MKPRFFRPVGGSLAQAQDHRAAVRGTAFGSLLRTFRDRPAGKLELYVVFSFFRPLALREGVMKRALDGNASTSQTLAQMRHVIEVMAKEAQAFAGVTRFN